MGIRNLIRENKIHQLYSQMQMGQEKFGMQTMNQSLVQLYKDRKITYDICVSESSNVDELKGLLARAGLAQAAVSNFK